MVNFIILAIVGLIAQLVDGSLGMAYGVTSTTLLVLVGVAPAVASASVHIAEVGTTLVSGVSHWRFGNVDWRGIGWLAIPGGIAAFVGAVFLSSLSAEFAAPIVSIILLILGIYILLRFSFSKVSKLVSNKPVPRWFLAPLGLVAGFIDALGGGGWGPVATPTLLTSQRMEPRKVIGTVDTSEFIVALGASIGFLISLSLADIPLGVVSALLLGGIIAAPLAAWLVRHLNTRVLGTLVGGIIVLTNARTLLRAAKLEADWGIYAYSLILIVWAIIFGYTLARIYRERQPIVSATPAVSTSDGQ